MKHALSTYITILSLGLFAGKAPAETQPAAPPPLKPQSTCPVMGGAINRTQHVDVRGQRIYVCCPGCIETIARDPEAALQNLHAKGQFAESLQRVCPVMGKPINPKLFVEYQGRRLYVCCPGCIETVKRNPQNHAEKIAKQVADAAKKTTGE